MSTFFLRTAVNEVYIHQPISWLCQGLSDAASQFYVTLKTGIKKAYARRSIELTELAVLLLQVSDKIEEMKIKLNAKDCRECCEQVVWYLRIKMLHADSLKVRTTLIILDFLVKNNQNQIHYQLNRRRVMKTIGIVIRSNYFHGDSRISSLGLDIIQSWYIAFLPRAQMYPNIIDTYLKLKYKYCCRFPRAETEERVKIFVGPNCFYVTSYSSIPADLFSPLINNGHDVGTARPAVTGVIIREEEKEAILQDLILFDDIIINVENADTTTTKSTISKVEEPWGNCKANSISNNPVTTTNEVAPLLYYHSTTLPIDNPFAQSIEQHTKATNVASMPPRHTSNNTIGNNPFMTTANEQDTATTSVSDCGRFDLTLVKDKADSIQKLVGNCDKLIDASLASSVADLFGVLKTIPTPSNEGIISNAPIKAPKPEVTSLVSTGNDHIHLNKHYQYQNNATEQLQQGSIDDSISNQTVIDDGSSIISHSEDILLPSAIEKLVKTDSYVTPGVDHNNVIKFYGNNRVVIKKT